MSHTLKQPCVEQNLPHSVEKKSKSTERLYNVFKTSHLGSGGFSVQTQTV